MTPLEELEAAELTPNQTAHFIGWIGGALDRKGVISDRDWSEAVKGPKEFRS